MPQQKEEVTMAKKQDNDAGINIVVNTNSNNTSHNPSEPPERGPRWITLMELIALSTLIVQIIQLLHLGS